MRSLVLLTLVLASFAVDAGLIRRKLDGTPLNEHSQVAMSRSSDSPPSPSSKDEGSKPNVQTNRVNSSNSLTEDENTKIPAEQKFLQFANTLVSMTGSQFVQFMEQVATRLNALETLTTFPSIESIFTIDPEKVFSLPELFDTFPGLDDFMSYIDPNNVFQALLDPNTRRIPIFVNDFPEPGDPQAIYITKPGYVTLITSAIKRLSNLIPFFG